MSRWHWAWSAIVCRFWLGMIGKAVGVCASVAVMEGALLRAVGDLGGGADPGAGVVPESPLADRTGEDLAGVGEMSSHRPSRRAGRRWLAHRWPAPSVRIPPAGLGDRS